MLIHALPFDHNLWLYQVERFSRHFTTLAMDLRGWGRRPSRARLFRSPTWATNPRYAEDEGVSGGAVVLGCSIGSKIALMLACDQPEIFRPPILVGGNSGPQAQFDHRIAAIATSGRGTLKDYHLGHLRHGVTQAWADTPTGRYLLDGFVERGAALDAESIAQVLAR